MAFTYGINISIFFPNFQCNNEVLIRNTFFFQKNIGENISCTRIKVNLRSYIKIWFLRVLIKIVSHVTKLFRYCFTSKNVAVKYINPIVLLLIKNTLKKYIRAEISAFEETWESSDTNLISSCFLIKIAFTYCIIISILFLIIQCNRGKKILFFVSETYMIQNSAFESNLALFGHCGLWVNPRGGR